MKKLLKTLYLLPTVCAALFFAACSDSEINRINKNWSVDLPKMDIEYSYESVGWFGDGIYYYVCAAEKDDLGVTFSDGANALVEYIFTYNKALLTGVEDKFPDYAHDLSLYAKVKNEGNDSLNLIYDNDENKLIILEIHT